MELLNLSTEQFKLFLMILMRVSVVLFLFPVFGSPMFPALAKTGLALILSLLFLNTVQIDLSVFPHSPVQLSIILFSEFVIGLVLGLTIRLYLAGVQLAGRLVGFQMGFMMANVVDPLSGTSVSLIEQIGYWVALVIFLMINGHHVFIIALTESFKLIEIGWISIPGGFLNQIVKLSSDMFSLAVKIGSPAIAALLFTSVIFGLCAKFMPQMNILIVGFPVKIAVGLIFLGISFEIIGIFTRSYVDRFPTLLTSLMIWMGGK